MEILFMRRPRPLVIAGILVVLSIAAFLLFFKNDEVARETAVVDRGDVSVLVSVSGAMRTRNTAALSFPKTGIIEDIAVREGDAVIKGQVLASLTRSAALATYNNAVATLKSAQADREELVTGPQQEARDVTRTTIEQAESDLARTIEEQDVLVENARRILLSDDLEAVPSRTSNDDTPPTISGTFTCASEGAYTLEIYRSDSRSGYSYYLGGLENGTFAASDAAPAPLGSCGLFVRFAEGVSYRTETWTVDIPNTRSSSYPTNYNAYTLAQKNRDSAIAEAREKLVSAQRQGTLENAPARREALMRADAQISQAQAQVDLQEAGVADVTIRAPFDGIITNVSMSRGEASTQDTTISMTANDDFELKIRIPEIDITHIESGDSASASFDARPDATLPATVAFVSPLPTEIDGVAYFEALLSLESTPEWMRTGLNADVDIVIDRATSVTRIPKRFIGSIESEPYLLTLVDGKEQRIPVSIGLVGNDGFVEVRDVAEGTHVIAPL